MMGYNGDRNFLKVFMRSMGKSVGVVFENEISMNKQAGSERSKNSITEQIGVSA